MKGNGGWRGFRVRAYYRINSPLAPYLIFSWNRALVSDCYTGFRSLPLPHNLLGQVGLNAWNMISSNPMRPDHGLKSLSRPRRTLLNLVRNKLVPRGRIRFTYFFPLPIKGSSWTTLK